MRSFSTYLNVYRDSRLQNTETEINLRIIPPEIPSSCKNDIDVASFFEGRNVRSEHISTYNRYCYKAKIYTLKKHEVKELEKAIKLGLDELGYSYTEFYVKSLPKASHEEAPNINDEFEVAITIDEQKKV